MGPGKDFWGQGCAGQRAVAIELGTGLGKLKGRMFRIGHLGDCNDLTLMAAVCGIEMGLRLAQVPLTRSGVGAAMESFASTVRT
jgi:alanine-glyoxylate transaminase/serine-glyoxylate transaminase/serine-pyruvate transaminase